MKRGLIQTLVLGAFAFTGLNSAHADVDGTRGVIDQVDLGKVLKGHNERLEILKARRLAERGETVKSLSHYESVLRKHPGTVWLQIEIGDMLVQAGEFGLALPHLEDAIKADPLNVDALRLSALTRDALGHQPEAIKLYRKVLLRDPNNARARFNLGRLYFSAGDMEGAERTYRDLIARHKGHWQAYNNLGIVMIERGQPTAALSPLRRALRLQPDDHGVLYNLGRAHAARKEHKPALKYFDRALDGLGRDDLSAGAYHFSRGESLFAMDKYPEAAQAFRDTIRLDPENAAAHLNLGASLGNSGDYKGAVAALESAANKTPQAEIYRQIAICYYNDQSMDAALSALHKARAISPNDAATFALISDVHTAKGESGKAKAASKKACSLGLKAQCK